ncbi:MAG: transposase family protein [Gammaproteobacteria bacterium]|jgi:transposase|nr:transposase family protein [Gammaproteobacteria bacterium]
MANKVKKIYTQEFKVEAVKLITEQGYTIAEVARNLGISGSALGKWKRVLEKGINPKAAFPGKGHPRDVELHALQKELEKVKRERDILKKALGYFAKVPE